MPTHDPGIPQDARQEHAVLPHVVLQAELDAIDWRRRHQADPAAAPAPGRDDRQEAASATPDEQLRRVRAQALKMDLAGLAFSGGGIRSATFNLGMLQGLADLNLLGQFDYLSTVSGGGYIGSWLVAWIKRTGDPRVVQQQLRPVWADPARGPATTGKQPAHPQPLASEAEAIRHLRAHSNYLSPQLGLFSADTWVIIATYLRNSLLVWLVLVPGLVAVLLLTRLILLSYADAGHHGGGLPVWWLVGIGLVASAIVLRKTKPDWLAWSLFIPGVVLWLLHFGIIHGGHDVDWGLGLAVLVVLAAWVFGWIVYLMPSLQASAAQPSRRHGVRLLHGTVIVPLVTVSWLASALFAQPAWEGNGRRFLQGLIQGLQDLAASFLAWFPGTDSARSSVTDASFLAVFASLTLLLIAVHWITYVTYSLLTKRTAGAAPAVPPRPSSPPSRPEGGGSGWFRRVLASVATMLAWALFTGTGSAVTCAVFWYGALHWLPSKDGHPTGSAVCLLGGFFAGLVGEVYWLFLRWRVPDCRQAPAHKLPGAGHLLGIIVCWPLTGIIAGFTGGALLALLAVEVLHPWEKQPGLIAAFGPPLILAVFMTATVVKIGFLRRQIPDAAREWWSSLCARLMIYGGVWISILAVVVYGPWLLLLAAALLGPWIHAAMTSGWLLTTLGGVLAGHSASTGSGRGNRALEWLAQIAPHVFIAGLLSFGSLLTALAIAEAVGAPAPIDPQSYLRSLEHRGRHVHIGSLTVHADELVMASAATAALLLMLLAAWRVDVNACSMHAFYGNRLVRCYLGASRPKEPEGGEPLPNPGQGEGLARRPNPITGFDPLDDFPLRQLDIGATGGPDSVPGARYWGPYPIVGTALNLTKGADLAWQERKSDSFVLTPKYCGSGSTDYRPLPDYAGDVMMAASGQLNPQQLQMMLQLTGTGQVASPPATPPTAQLQLNPQQVAALQAVLNGTTPPAAPSNSGPPPSSTRPSGPSLGGSTVADTPDSGTSTTALLEQLRLAEQRLKELQEIRARDSK